MVKMPRMKQVIRCFEENEETRMIIARLAKENNMERWIQIYTEVTGLDDELKMTVASGIRRAVEARRKGQGRQPTAAQEQGKKVCFTEEEKEAQEARESQERFMEKRRRAHEAREEEWKEQEKKKV